MRLPLSLLVFVSALAACSARTEENEPTTNDDNAVYAVVPDCRTFDLHDTIARTKDLSPDYQCEVSRGLSRSSQPNDGWIKSLSDPHVRRVPFRSIVNLRGENGANGEAPSVQRYGMTPLNIRVMDMTAPTREQIVTFLAFVTDEAHQPALVHCKAGQGRTGTFVAAYRMIVQRWSPEDAIKEARSFNVNDVQIAFLGDLAKHLDEPDLARFRDAPGGALP